jgi:hypothetical protein
VRTAWCVDSLTWPWMISLWSTTEIPSSAPWLAGNPRTKWRFRSLGKWLIHVTYPMVDCPASDLGWHCWVWPIPGSHGIFQWNHDDM